MLTGIRERRRRALTQVHGVLLCGLTLFQQLSRAGFQFCLPRQQGLLTRGLALSIHRGLTRAALECLQRLAALAPRALEFSDGGDVAPGLLLEPKRVDVGPVSLRQSDLETGAQHPRRFVRAPGGIEYFRGLRRQFTRRCTRCSEFSLHCDKAAHRTSLWTIVCAGVGQGALALQPAETVFLRLPARPLPSGVSGVSLAPLSALSGSCKPSFRRRNACIRLLSASIADAPLPLHSTGIDQIHG